MSKSLKFSSRLAQKAQKSLRKPTRDQKVMVLLILGVITPTLIYHGFKYRAVTLANQYLKKGFGALADDVLEPFRYQLANSPENCKLLLSAYYSIQKAEKLNWASQACLEARIEIPESYLGLGLAQELAGRDNQAIQILSQFSKKFPTLPDFDMRIGQIYKRNQKMKEASEYFLSAAQKDPLNQQLNFDIFQHFYSLSEWQQAKTLAMKIKQAPTENPEVKLLLADAILKAGDKKTAAELTEQANLLILAKTPDRRVAFEQTYPALFKIIPNQTGSGIAVKTPSPGESARHPASP